MAGAAIGAGLGAVGGLINHNQKMGQYNRDKQLAADIERNSSWTGVHGNMPNAPGSAFGSALQGGLGGAMFGQQFGGAKPSPAPLGVDPNQSSMGNASAGGFDNPMAGSSWENPTLYRLKA